MFSSLVTRLLFIGRSLVTRLRVLVIKAANSLMPSHPGPPNGKCLVAWFKFLEQGMSNKIRMERSGVHKNWQLEWERVTRIEAHGPDKVIKPYQKQNTRSRACLATMHNGLCQCSICEQGMLLFKFSTGSKFRPGSKLHALTLATCACVLLSTDAVAID